MSNLFTGTAPRDIEIEGAMWHMHENPNGEFVMQTDKWRLPPVWPAAEAIAKAVKAQRAFNANKGARERYIAKHLS